MRKFGRLIGLIYLLKNKTLHAKQIAQRLGVTERTVYRDINTLNEAFGDYVQIISTEKGYSLNKSAYTPPLNILPDEYMALHTAVSALDSNNPHYQLAQQTLNKILEYPGARPSLAALEQYLQITQSTAKDRVPVKRLQEIENLLRKREILELRYFSHNSGQIQTFLFAPYALVFRKNAWYLIGHHQGKNKTLLLRAYRIQAMKSTGQPFEVPADFSVHTFFKEHWEVFDGIPEPVHLRFYGASAWRIQEMNWHPSQQFIHHGDQCVDLLLRVPVNPEFKSWVLGWGSECEVLAPLALRTHLAEEARRILARVEQPVCR